MSWLSSLYKVVNQRRSRLSRDKEREYTNLEEKKNDDLNEEIVGASTISISVGNESSFTGSLQRRNNSRELRAGEIWTAAAQGAFDVVEGQFFLPEAADINTVHPKHGTLFPLLHAQAISGS
jgi:hypothetical protein